MLHVMSKSSDEEIKIYLGSNALPVTSRSHVTSQTDKCKISIMIVIVLSIRYIPIVLTGFDDTITNNYYYINYMYV